MSSEEFQAHCGGFNQVYVTFEAKAAKVPNSELLTVGSVGVSDWFIFQKTASTPLF